MTSECSFQAVDEELDSIQWAVTPMKNAFVWSTNQRSVIVEMHSLHLDCIMVRHENKNREKTTYMKMDVALCKIFDE